MGISFSSSPKGNLDGWADGDGRRPVQVRTRFTTRCRLPTVKTIGNSDYLAIPITWQTRSNGKPQAATIAGTARRKARYKHTGIAACSGLLDFNKKQRKQDSEKASHSSRSPAYALAAMDGIATFPASQLLFTAVQHIANSAVR